MVRYGDHTHQHADQHLDGATVLPVRGRRVLAAILRHRSGRSEVSERLQVLPQPERPHDDQIQPFLRCDLLDSPEQVVRRRVGLRARVTPHTQQRLHDEQHGAVPCLPSAGGPRDCEDPARYLLEEVDITSKALRRYILTEEAVDVWWQVPTQEVHLEHVADPAPL